MKSSVILASEFRFNKIQHMVPQVPNTSWARWLVILKWW